MTFDFYSFIDYVCVVFWLGFLNFQLNSIV